MEHTHKYYAAGVGLWRDYTCTFRFLSVDNDAVVRIFPAVSVQRWKLSLDAQGVLFRFVDDMNYYDFSWTADAFVGPLRMLRKKVNGVYTVLQSVRRRNLCGCHRSVRASVCKQDTGVPYTVGAWYSVRVDVIGTYACMRVAVCACKMWLPSEPHQHLDPRGGGQPCIPTMADAGGRHVRRASTACVCLCCHAYRASVRRFTIGSIAAATVANAGGYFDDFVVTMQGTRTRSDYRLADAVCLSQRLLWERSVLQVRCEARWSLDKP